ncbi:MAG TPA: 50S ribosomal protein L4, partial [Acidimicrobiales bacterium]
MSSTGTVLRHTMKKERPEPVVRTAARRNAAGHALGEVELEPTVFGLEPNRAVLHQVVTAQLAANRSGTQSTRTRAEVRGGGAKPYRQKGTGRARQGSTRAPSMVGGGVALGPKPRSYAQRTPKKMVRLALLSALSDRADIGRVALIDEWGIEEPDTRAAVTILRKLKLDGSVLVVLAQDEIEIALSFRNIPEASITTHAELSAHDVVRNDWLLFSDRTLPGSAAAFAGTHEGRVDGDTARAETRAQARTRAEAAAEDEAAAEEAPAKKASRATKATKAARAPETVEEAEDVEDVEPETVEAEAEAADVTEADVTDTETDDADADTDADTDDADTDADVPAQAPARRR